MHAPKRALRIAPAAIVAAIILPAVPTTSSDERSVALAASPVDPCIERYLLKRQVRYVRAVYRRDDVSRRALRRIARMRSCSRSWRASRTVLRFQRRQGRARRERERSERCTPYGRWAIPAYIVWAESRYRNVPNSSGSDASGYYQIMRSTWINFGGAVRGVRYEAMAASKAEQDCVASRIWADGSHHWAATR